MNRKISLGAALSYMLVVAMVTFSLTVVFSMNQFNARLTNVQQNNLVYDKINEIDRLFRQNFVGSVDDTVMVGALTTGYLTGGGDPYSQYLSAEEYQRILDERAGWRIGIGAELVLQPTGYLRVASLYTESPARVSGMLKNDLIVAINDEQLTGEGAEAAIRSLSQNVDEEVKLTVQRGTEEHEFRIVKQRVETNSVDYEVLDETIGYVRIRSWNDNAYTQFERAMRSLGEVEGIRGFIFDVRGNTGGNLDVTCDSLDMMVGPGDIVSLEQRGGRISVYRASDENSITLPACILVNGASSDSTELFAEVLRQQNGAMLVGAQTAGHGMRQTFARLSDGSALRVSDAYYILPDGTRFEGQPLAPDYEVTISEEQEKALYYLSGERDDQLIRALDLLSQTQ